LGPHVLLAAATVQIGTPVLPADAEVLLGQPSSHEDSRLVESRRLVAVMDECDAWLLESLAKKTGGDHVTR